LRNSHTRLSGRLDLTVGCQFLATGVAIGTVPAYLRESLVASRAVTGAATTIFFIAALVSRPFIGRFLDRSGRLPLLVWPPIVSALLVAIVPLAHSPWQVGVLRFLAGSVGAGFYTAALALSTDLAAPGKQTQAVARLSIAVYLGFVFGPLIAELLLRSGFAAAFIGAAFFHVAAAVSARFVTLGAGAGSVDGADGADGADTKWVETRQSRKHKLVLVHPAAIGPGVALFAVAFSFSTVSAFSRDYGKNLKLQYPALLFASFALSVLLVRLVSGRIADQRGPFSVAVPGMALGAVGLVVAATAQRPAVGVLGMVLIGFGSGASFPAITSIVTSSAPAAEKGVAVASLLMFNDFGQACAGPLAGWVADQWGWRWVFGVPAVVAVGGVVAISVLAVASCGKVSATGGRRVAIRPE
jgi:MFS family permease